VRPLAAHDGVDKVAFTVRPEVGRLIVQAAAGNLKRSRLSWVARVRRWLYKDADMDVAILVRRTGSSLNQGPVL